MTEHTYNAVLIGPPPQCERQSVDAEYVGGAPQAELESFSSVDGIVILNIYRLAASSTDRAETEPVEYHWASVQSVDAL